MESLVDLFFIYSKYLELYAILSRKLYLHKLLGNIILSYVVNDEWDDVGIVIECSGYDIRLETERWSCNCMAKLIIPENSIIGSIVWNVKEIDDEPVPTHLRNPLNPEIMNTRLLVKSSVGDIILSLFHCRGEFTVCYHPTIIQWKNHYEKID